MYPFGGVEGLDDQNSRFSEGKSNVLFAFALVVLVVEEIVTAYVDPILGLLISFGGAIGVAVVPYVLKSGQAVRGAMQCFSLLFLSRMAIMVVPALILPPPVLFVVIYSVYILISVAYIVERPLSLKTVGFQASSLPYQIFAGLVLGLAMGVVEFAILNPEMDRYLLFSEFSGAALFYIIVIMFFFVAVGEELLFRGLVQTSLEKLFDNPLKSVTAVSSLFAIMHMAYVTSLEKTLELAYVFAASTAIGYSFMKTRSLILPVIAHGTANTILFGILPYIL